MGNSQNIGWVTALTLVVANMIGAGIFTSLGFQLVETQNSWSILILWSLGALMAICGALSYAELGTYWQRSGGEYHYLSEAFHPLLGYLSGWVSLTIGFSAPIALAGMALGDYVSPYFGVSGLLIAVLGIISISLLHSMSIRRSGLLQKTTTFFKVGLILLLIYYGLDTPSEQSSFNWDAGWEEEIVLPAFAVSLVYVTFSYSGWNAASYIVGEIRQVSRNLPIALLGGTLLVGILYLCLNYVFLKHNSLDSLQGELEVGQLTATAIFGAEGGKLISFGIGILLISSISAMTWAGPRVTQVMGEDHPLWRWFAKKSAAKIPMRALWLQTVISLFLLLSGTFEQVLIYSGFVLQLFAALAVAGLFVSRKRAARAATFKSPLFPLPQLIFLLLSLWILIYLLVAQPIETGFGVLNLLIGGLLFYLGRSRAKKK